MKESEFKRLQEESWRRALNDAEKAQVEAFLAESPELRGDWETEMAVQRLTRRLPAVSLRPDFTNRVMAAVDRERERVSWPEAMTAGFRAIWEAAWLRPVVYAGLVICLGWVGYSQYVWHQRAERAERLAVMSRVVSVPSVETLKDFEAIQHLDQAPKVDEELLVALE